MPGYLKRWARGGALHYEYQGQTSEVALNTTVAIKRCRNGVFLECLRREHLVLRSLAGAGISVPRVLDYAELERDGSCEAWLVTSRVNGQPLLQVMRNATTRRRTALLGRLGEELAVLHKAGIPKELAAGMPWIDRKLSEAQLNLGWCKGSAALLMDLQRHRPASAPEVLIHGDAALDNVIVAAGDRMRFIDWSSGDQGDPRHDLAIAIRPETGVEFTEANLAAFFDGYGADVLDPRIRAWFEDLYKFF